MTFYKLALTPASLKIFFSSPDLYLLCVSAWQEEHVTIVHQYYQSSTSKANSTHKEP